MNNDQLCKDVADALEMVREAIDDVVAFIMQDITIVSQKGDFAGIQHLVSQGKQVKAVQAKVNKLQDEWGNLFPPATEFALSESIANEPSRVEPIATKSRPRRKNLERGRCTPEQDFYLPILEILLKHGGKLPVSKVLSKLGVAMKPTFNEYDFQTLPSTPKQPRWCKTAHRVRFKMVQERLLASKSPRGIWEVTEAGKKYREKHLTDD
jgi:hypothetical protein